MPGMSTACQVRLTVISRPHEVLGQNLPAAANPATLAAAGSSATHSSGTCYLQLASGSDCILYTRLDATVPAGQLLLDVSQQHNLRLLPQETYCFSVYERPPPEELPLVELECEVLLLEHRHGSAEVAAAAADAEELPDASSSEGTDEEVEGAAAVDASTTGMLQVDAQQVAAALSRSCFGRILAINEHVVLSHQGALLLLRVTVTHTASAEEREELIGYHCFRGRLVPDTQVYLSTVDDRAAARSSADTASWQQQQQQQQQVASDRSSGKEHSPAATAGSITQQLADTSLQEHRGPPTAYADPTSINSSSSSSGAPGVPSRLARLQAQQQLPVLQLINAPCRVDRPPPTNVVHVTTSDGEWFPVKKALLRPCLKLTQVVRDSGDTAPCITVNIDTLTFDRVLIFLEASALDKDPPQFALQHLPALTQAAEELGLTSLSKYCAAKAGSRAAALARYTPAQVAQAIAAGCIWLLLDGMVLDVGAWLPQHPGGATIIPRQAMNVDCSRFFEVYHASRESFLYIKELYIGELYPPEAAAAVPAGGGNLPSQEFLQQLREYTTWRRDPGSLPDSTMGVAFKSF